MMERPESCPKCGCNSIRNIWCRGPNREIGRWLKYECYLGSTFDGRCRWESEPYTPPQQEIKTKKKLHVGQFGSFEYTVYDQYGHSMIMSRGYDTRKLAVEALTDDLKKHPGSTAVLWPRFVTAVGKVFESPEKICVSSSDHTWDLDQLPGRCVKCGISYLGGL